MAVDDLGRAAVGEFGMTGDVGGARNLVFMAGDEHAVPGGNEVGFDEIRALADGETIGLERVFGAVTARPAVGDDDQSLVVGAMGGRHGMGILRECCRCQREESAGGQGGKQPAVHDEPLVRSRGNADSPLPARACSSLQVAGD